MSHEGNIYFFAYHLLYTVMQVYYAFQEQRDLEMNQLGERYLKLILTYEDIAGRCLEEIVFPFEYESLHVDKAREMENFAEPRDEAMYKGVYDEVLSSSYRLREKYLNLKLNVLVYYQYCTFLARVLEQFDTIMNMENMIPTDYFKHYQLERAILKDLHGQIENEDVLGKNKEKDIQAEIKSLAERLGIEWNKAIFAAVQDFENPPQSGVTSI